MTPPTAGCATSSPRPGRSACTEELLGTVADFSRSTGVAFHIHILETRVQRVTGIAPVRQEPDQLMADLDALHEKTSIAHAIWIDDDDIGLIARAARPWPTTRCATCASAPAWRRSARS